MPKIKFTAESIENNRKVVDDGMYLVTLTGFKPKLAKTNDGSINYNPQFEISSMESGAPAPTKDDGKPIPVFYSLNTKLPNIINDFCHCFGLPMEDDGKGGYSIPGIWVPESEEDISKCEYKGPLLGRKGKMYLIKTDYQGQPKNEIKFFGCAIPNCAQRFPKVRHATSLQFSSSK